MPASRTRISAQPDRSLGSGLVTGFSFPLATWKASTRLFLPIQQSLCTPLSDEKRRKSGFGFDGDIERPSAERTNQKPSEAAGPTPGNELTLLSRREVQVNGLPVPGVVHAQSVMARSYRYGDAVPVKELRYTLAVDLHNDLTLLDVFGRGATDGYESLR